MSAQNESPSGMPWWWVLGRDIVLFAAGLVVLFLEVARAEVRDSVLTLVGVLLGGPAGAAGLTSLAGALRSRGGTPGPSPSSPEGPPQPSASSSSSGA